MDTITAADVLSVAEAAELRDRPVDAIFHAVRSGALKPWKLRPILFLRADVIAWVPRKAGGPSGLREPGARTREIGGTRLTETLASVAKHFGVSRNYVLLARRRIAIWDAKQAEKNGQPEKGNKTIKIG